MKKVHMLYPAFTSAWVKINVASDHTSAITQNFILAFATAGVWRLCLDLSVFLSCADIPGFVCCSRWLLCSSIYVNNTWMKDTRGSLCHNENMPIIAWWLILELQPDNPNKQDKQSKNKTEADQLALLHCQPPQKSADMYYCCMSLSKPKSKVIM